MTPSPSAKPLALTPGRGCRGERMPGAQGLVGARLAGCWLVLRPESPFARAPPDHDLKPAVLSPAEMRQCAQRNKTGIHACAVPCALSPRDSSAAALTAAGR
jgi:hypothetical protein